VTSRTPEPLLPVDEVTRRILRILERDGRTDPRQIALMLDLTQEEVEARIAAAETEDVLVRTKAVVNWEKAGEQYVLALIEVKVAPQRETGFDAIAERIYRYPEARSVYLVSGTYDLAVQVVGRTMQDVAMFVAQKLAPLDGVQSTVTHFMLRRYKEDGDVLVGHETAERLAITP
jgi:DNA-binding Lrp family transcriptional regulator